jgi:hypothetical protein
MHGQQEEAKYDEMQNIHQAKIEIQSLWTFGLLGLLDYPHQGLGATPLEHWL